MKLSIILLINLMDSAIEKLSYGRAWIISNLWMQFHLFFSYAGLHCVVIKGYSKSAGYQPGVKFEDNRFRNSWNAVYVAGAWRFVQCNWGARHLVNAKEVPKPGRAKSDSLRLVQIRFITSYIMIFLFFVKFKIFLSF